MPPAGTTARAKAARMTGRAKKTPTKPGAALARGAAVEGAEIADAFHAGGAEEGGGVEFDDFEAESVTRR